ncbi:FtsK/SpoIIIE family DNA translocase [Anaerolinea sp.]|uniref:FtsK/SpoIIIE family DNA translocase n=1 Tax=Anaerolinea sp. TaxID=1872519 RepID=UPI002ACE9000|nr:DNA translocase FtsK 4TM domain-containing protein [Anaerolinea sp.]
MDLLGVLLALLGLLSLLSLFSSHHGILTRWWVTALQLMGGDGAFILPLVFLLFGFWLVLRNVDRFPSPSIERGTGLLLLYWVILAVFHLYQGGGWELAAAGKGGGYIGALLERLLVSAIGQAGAWVVLLAGFLLGVIMTADISMVDLVSSVESLVHRMRQESKRSRERLSAVERKRSSPVSLPQSPEQREELPEDFKPLPVHENELPPTTKPSVLAPSVKKGGGGSRLASSWDSSSRPEDEKPIPSSQQIWQLPSVDEILDPPVEETIQTNVDAERARLIEETLASFGAPVHVVEISRGPTVTRFGVEPDFIETRSGRMRVRVGKIAALADDLALALAAPRIRIQAPVPGRHYVGIEVPNIQISRVMLKEVIESEAFRKIRSPLRFALGKDVAGHSVAYDLATMPHLLIAGTTGSGKSVCVNSILTCLLLHNSPVELRLILVDPKRVELTGYNGIPHLLAPVVTEAEKVVGALQWVQREMDARYHRFSQSGVRNIAEYNRKFSPPLPYLVVLVDELADLMMMAPEETERSLTRLAQLARATGIHLVLATQRPSVDVITGLIKANFPARIAFAVASGVDSRVILDQPGAERLLGRGDMLFQAPDASAPVRIQGVYVSDLEIQRLVDFWRLQDMNVRATQRMAADSNMAEPVNMDLPPSVPLTQVPLFDAEMGGREGDPLLEEAKRIVRQEGKASISMLQRKLRIGYTRAARLIDALEETGVIGPASPTSQVREVLDWENEEE